MYMQSYTEHKYTQLCSKVSDINEHLPTLYKYATECSHITECGVRDVVSSYAFANAIRHKKDNKLILIDIIKAFDTVERFLDECEEDDVHAIFREESDLTCPIEKTDLLFIDTWHVYGQLKRELARWNSSVNKYIVMHDTTVDGEIGESIRMHYEHNIEEEVKQTGWPEEEIRKGLWPAVEEFLAEHPEWILKERFTNNNGLTILERSTTA
jgi:hypothetical protein